MGLSKEEFLELMARNEFGKKTTKRNKTAVELVYLIIAGLHQRGKVPDANPYAK